MSALENLDFSSLPPIFILTANFPENARHETEDAIYEAGGQLSYDPQESRIFLGRLSQKKRAAFELRAKGVWTVESAPIIERPRKKRKVTQQRTSSPTRKSEDDSENSANENLGQLTSLSKLETHVVVLKVEWLHNSMTAGHFLPYEPFLVYSGRIVDRPGNESNIEPAKDITYIKAHSDSAPSAAASSPNQKQQDSLTSILYQTRIDGTDTQLPIMKYSPRRFRDSKTHDRVPASANRPTLKRTTTSEHDLLNSTDTSNLPPPPSWMLEPHPRANYACMRSTFANPANDAFLKHLYKIKEARLLTLDEIGVRAYSTSIAALAAYQHVVSSPAEITRLPGCSDKIAALWVEWYTSAQSDSERYLAVTRSLDEDEDLKHLKAFYDIWGVGAETARKFYFEYGWKELDDVVEFGWNNGSLNRVQQIGVKFYDDFMVKIDRHEVEQIADIVLHHARLCRDIPQRFWSNKQNDHRGNWNKPDNGKGDTAWDPRDMVCVIVGGYRRGKKQCGDVDVILSHRDEEYTKNLVIDVVKSLEDAGFITHTLTLHTSHSDRDQQTLPYRNRGHAGHGFDTLDKALCVWQDPNFDDGKHAKNPNIHRRVDIIVSPWRTVGAAVLGWSGATTFERDVRRWCRKEKGWKFDSSGVRDRSDGAVLDFESPRTKRNGKQREGEVIDDGDGWEDRERRLMDGIGICWRPATERSTG